MYNIFLVIFSEGNCGSKKILPCSNDKCPRHARFIILLSLIYGYIWLESIKVTIYFTCKKLWYSVVVLILFNGVSTKLSTLVNWYTCVNIILDLIQSRCSRFPERGKVHLLNSIFYQIRQQLVSTFITIVCTSYGMTGLRN